MTYSVESAENFSVPQTPMLSTADTDLLSGFRGNFHRIVATLALLATPLAPALPAAAHPLSTHDAVAVSSPVADKTLAENKERKKLTAQQKEELGQTLGAEFLQKYPQYRPYSIGQIDGGKTLIVIFISGSDKLNVPDTRVAVLLHKLDPKKDEDPTKYFLDAAYQPGQSTLIHQIVLAGKNPDGKSWELYLPMDASTLKTQGSNITTVPSACQNPPCFRGSPITSLKDDK